MDGAEPRRTWQRQNLVRHVLVYLAITMGLCCCTAPDDESRNMPSSDDRSTPTATSPQTSSSTAATALPSDIGEFVRTTFDLTVPLRAEALRLFVERHGGDPDLVDAAVDFGLQFVETADLIVCFQYPDTEPPGTPGHAIAATVGNDDVCPE